MIKVFFSEFLSLEIVAGETFIVDSSIVFAQQVLQNRVGDIYSRKDRNSALHKATYSLNFQETISLLNYSIIVDHIIGSGKKTEGATLPIYFH